MLDLSDSCKRERKVLNAQKSVKYIQLSEFLKTITMFADELDCCDVNKQVTHNNKESETLTLTTKYSNTTVSTFLLCLHGDRLRFYI